MGDFMPGTYTTAGATIGSAIPGVGTVIGGAVGGIIDVFDSIFGGSNKNPGFASGNKWIPGDLVSRLQTVDALASQLGLMPQDLDQSKIYDILTSPGIWQDNIRSYLYSVLNKKNNQTTPSDSNPPSSPATQKNIAPLFLIGGAALLLLFAK